MRLPELKEGMVIKCLTSKVEWWTEGKEYPVRASSSEGMVIFDNDFSSRGSYEDLSATMTFEVIEPEWDGEGYPPVGIDCMISIADGKPAKSRIDFIGSTYCCYTLYEDCGLKLEATESVRNLYDLKFAQVNAKRQEAINSLSGNGCYTSYARAESLLDEIIAGRHKWLEYTGGK